MAVVSSHTLNGVDGTHAGHIPVRLIHVGSQKVIFDAEMDDGGRLTQTIDPERIDQNTSYELVLKPPVTGKNTLYHVRVHKLSTKW